LNEKDEKIQENPIEPEMEEESLINENIDGDIIQEDIDIEKNEIEQDLEEIREEILEEEFDEENNQEIEKQDFSLEQDEGLEDIEPLEEGSKEQENGLEIGDSDEVQAPQELTKEELELQLKLLRRNLIEGALYAAGRPLDVEELSTKLEIPKKEVEELVRVVAFDYLEREGALIVAQIGEKYQMQLRPELTETVSKFAKGGAIAERYLRTLTVIALKQPILKSTVIKIRGTGAYEHIKYLLDNDLISAVKKGRSAELTTTDKYADMFGLPKNKEELKRMMISQLGLGEDAK
jgi:segregation and condensation protein B